MKKFALLLAAGLMLGGAAFAQEEENGALGFGILTEGTGGGKVTTGNLRGSLFLDVGYQLAGPIYYGFEFQGDVKQMGKDTFQFQTQDVTYIDLGGGDAVIFLDTNNYTKTYTLWDLDFSPRGYLSFDLGSKIQILGFGGLNYNWQTLDYELTKTSVGPATYKGKTLNKGDTYKESTNVGDGFWSIVAGFRVSVGAFYVDYTRFLDDSGKQTSWNAYNKDRLGIGINLRF